MNEARIFIKRPASTAWEDKGSHSFASFPRIGEHIEIAEKQHTDLYKVVAFHHCIDPSTRYHIYGAGEIYAVWEGKIDEIVNQLFRQHAQPDDAK